MQRTAFLHVNRNKFAAYCKFIAVYSYFCSRLQILFRFMIERKEYISALSRWKDKKTVKQVYALDWLLEKE